MRKGGGLRTLNDMKVVVSFTLVRVVEVPPVAYTIPLDTVPLELREVITCTPVVLSPLRPRETFSP